MSNWDRVKDREDLGPFLANRDPFYAAILAGGTFIAPLPHAARSHSPETNAVRPHHNACIACFRTFRHRKNYRPRGQHNGAYGARKKPSPARDRTHNGTQSAWEFSVLRIRITREGIGNSARQRKWANC
jgi:hypothetical protein